MHPSYHPDSARDYYEFKFGGQRLGSWFVETNALAATRNCDSNVKRTFMWCKIYLRSVASAATVFGFVH